MAQKGYVLYERLERNQKKKGDSKYKHLKLPSAKSPKTNVTEHDVLPMFSVHSRTGYFRINKLYKIL